MLFSEKNFLYKQNIKITNNNKKKLKKINLKIPF